MASVNLNNAVFVKSAASPEGFIRDARPAVVFAGKSNVGKSSVINRVLNRKNFARVGEEPGKTIHVNYFLVDERVYFVDLPGYGYAKVSQAERQRWAGLMEAFFSEPGRASLGVMIVDSRHRPTADDESMARLFMDSGMPLAVAANKCDKLKKSELGPNLALIRETLSLPESVPLIAFSAQSGAGRDALLYEILRRV